MTTVISSNLVLSSAVLETNSGVMGFQNIVTFDSITCTSQTLESPCTNMANPATAYGWEATSTSTQTITIQSDGREIDYIGIARHNLSQAGLEVSIKYNGITVSPAQAISNNQAILFLLNSASPTTIEIVITGASVAPRISVLYIGKALRLERNIYVGHTPITYGRDRKTINGLSENGQYLGEVVVRQSNTTNVSLSNLTPDWYRNQLDPFFAAVPRVPCFWAWRPETYATEVGYAWVEGESAMSNQRSNGMVQASWTFRGIV